MTNANRKSLVGQTLQSNDGKTAITYALQELLVSNSVLDTYQAVHTAVNLKVMIKVLNPALTAAADFKDRYAEAIKALLKFNSPNLVKVYDYGQSGEYFYFATEYHKSPTLRVKLDDEKRLALSLASEYGRSLADALAYASAQGVVHGILSPGSVTISSKRGPLLMDIGLSGLFDSRLPRALADDLGLASYAAPEVLRGSAPSAASDQYTLTAMLFEMVTGRPPYPGSDIAAVINGHMNAPIPDPASIDPAFAPLSAIIARGLAKDPAQRYSTYNELIDALSKASAAAALLPAALPMQPAAAPVPAPKAAALPVQPPPAAPPVSAQEPAFAERTMPEMSVEELRRAAGVAPTPAPVQPPPAPVQEPSFAERTMPEVSIEELRRAAGVAPTPAPVQPPPAPVQEPSFAERTMPEMSVEELRRAAGVAPTPAPAVPVQPPPPAAPAPVQEPSFAERTMPEVSIEELRRAAGVAPTPAPVAPPIQPPPPVAPAPVQESFADRTMPEVSVAELRRAAGVAPTPAPVAPPVQPPPPVAPRAAAPVSDRTMPELSYEELRSAGLPPPTPPAPTPYNNFTTAPPGFGLQSNAASTPNESNRTMPEMAIPTYPGGAPVSRSGSVDYNFNSVPPPQAGAQSTMPHNQMEKEYGTEWMNRKDFMPQDDSRLESFLKTTPPSGMSRQKQSKSRTPLLIIGFVILLIIAMVIGVLVLKTLGVLHI